MRWLLILILSLATTIGAELPDRPLIIAHRGASHAAPENTMAAFSKAWDEGADGRIVCIHDEDTKRTTGRKLVIADTAWQTLAQLDAGSWMGPSFNGQKLPLLKDILDELPRGKFFFVEIKCGPEIIRPLAKIFKEFKADPKYVIIISFDPNVVLAAHEQLPDYQAHLVSSLKEIDRKDVQNATSRLLHDCKASGLQFKHSAPVSKPWLDAIRDRGQLTAAWTVDLPEDARRVARLGVDFITTNRPALVRSLWSEVSLPDARRTK